MNYLTRSFENFKKHFPVEIERQFKDGVGQFSFLCQRAGKGRFFFVAKDSSLGETVSVHKEIVEASMKSGIQIIMCLKGEYYKMWGAVILASDNYENTYNGATMINFTLAGVKAEKIALPGAPNAVATMIPRTTEQLKMAFGVTK